MGRRKQPIKIAKSNMLINNIIFVSTGWTYCVWLKWRSLKSQGQLGQILNILKIDQEAHCSGNVCATFIFTLFVLNLFGAKLKMRKYVLCTCAMHLWTKSLKLWMFVCFLNKNSQQIPEHFCSNRKNFMSHIYIIFSDVIDYLFNELNWTDL